MTERILLVQLADRGDLILTTPAISALREAKPDAHLTLLAAAHTAALLAETNLVNEIITFERKLFNSSRALLKPTNLRRIFNIGNYDTVVYFHRFTLKLGTFKFWLIARASSARKRIGLQNGNGWFLTESIPDKGFGEDSIAQGWLNLAALVGANSAPRPAIVHSTRFALKADNRPIVVIHAGGGGYSRARRWEPTKFATVADTLHEQANAQIILVGGTDDDVSAVKEAMKHTAIDLCGKTTMAELGAVIAQADLYIGTDSGVTHIAAAMNTPILALFGPSNHGAWGPWSPHTRVEIIRSEVACSPCSYVGHSIGLRDGCEARTCMKLITPQHVANKALTMLHSADNNVPQNTPSIHERTLVIKREWQRISILGLPVDGITYVQWLELIDMWVQERQHTHHVCTTNPEFTMIAQTDTNFANILRRASLCVPDGIGMLLAARYLGTKLPERVTGSDGVPIIAERAAQHGWRLFLLGAAPGIAEKAAQILVERYPGLQVAGTYSGSPSPAEEDEIVALVNASEADILFVAYGAPQQDKWIARNLPRLQVSMAMGVGGAFDFIAGIIPRAPQWMRRLGLEWLYRLYLEPRRIKRQMRLPRFVLAVLHRGERQVQ